MANDNDALSGYTDWKRWQADQFGRCSRGESRYFAWHLAHCHPHPIKSALELGFGNGNFLGHARGQGIQVAGIETQAALRDRAQAAGIESYASVDALSKDRRFDVIIAFDVFEHVEPMSLPQLLIQLRGHLAPDGVLLCRVPNGESPFGRIFQHGDVTHVNTLGLSKFNQLAAVVGLKVRCHGEMPWYLTARNPKRLLRAMVRTLLERTVAFAYHWDPKGLSPNLVVALEHVAKAPR